MLHRWCLSGGLAAGTISNRTVISLVNLELMNRLSDVLYRGRDACLLQAGLVLRTLQQVSVLEQGLGTFPILDFEELESSAEILSLWAGNNLPTNAGTRIISIVRYTRDLCVI